MAIARAWRSESPEHKTRKSATEVSLAICRMRTSVAFLSRIAPAIARALALASGSIVVLRVETVLNYIRFNREGQHACQAAALAYAPSDFRCGDIAGRQS